MSVKQSWNGLFEESPLLLAQRPAWAAPLHRAGKQDLPIKLEAIMMPISARMAKQNMRARLSRAV